MNIYQNGKQTIQTKRRVKFTPEEDEKLKFIIFQVGSLNWVKISQFMPGRNAKQCRDRYFNYLSQPHRIEKWEKEEDDIVLNLLSKIGPKWVEISKNLPGRSGNDVKNRWYKHLCKKYFYLKEKFFIPLPRNEKKNDSTTRNDFILNEKNEFNNIIQQYKISALLI